MNCKLFLLLCLPIGLSAQQTPRLTLKEAIQLAIQNNFSVTIAKNDAEAAALNNNWANAGALPQISITATKGLASNNIQQDLANGTIIKRNNAATNTLNGGLAVSWRFFDGWRMYATKNRLAEMEKMGQTQFTRISNETIYNVTLGYYNIIRLKQQYTAIKEAINLFTERRKIADARFTVGTSAKTDLLQAQVDLNEQQSNLLNTENDIARAKTTLNVWMVRDPATAFDTEDSFATEQPVNITALQQKAAQQNPEVLVAQHELAILLQTKKEINAQRLPTATLNGNYNFLRNKNAAGFTLLNQTYGPSASIGISIPIFTGGLVRRQLQVADINIKNQQLATQQLKNQLLGNLTNAYLNYTNALKLVSIEDKNLELIKENNTINLERFRLLSITSTDLRQGQVNFTEAQTRRINARFQAAVAGAEMYLLAGEINQ